MLYLLSFKIVSPISLALCLSVCLPRSISVCLSVCLNLSLSVCLSVSLSLSLSLSPSLSPLHIHSLVLSSSFQNTDGCFLSVFRKKTKTTPMDTPTFLVPLDLPSHSTTLTSTPQPQHNHNTQYPLPTTPLIQTLGTWEMEDLIWKQRKRQ